MLKKDWEGSVVDMMGGGRFVSATIQASILQCVLNLVIHPYPVRIEFFRVAWTASTILFHYNRNLLLFAAATYEEPAPILVS